MPQRLSLVVCLALLGCNRDLDFPAAPQLGSLAGRVVQSDGVAAADVSVELLPESGDALTVVAGGDGAFLAAALAPGPWQVRVAPAGFFELQRAVTITANKQRDLGTLTLVPLGGDANDGTLEGKVVAAQGGDISGAEVEVLVEATQQRAWLRAVGSSGEFSGQLPAGRYVVRASHPYFVTASRMGVEVQARQTVDLRTQPLSLDINPGTITGRVLRERDLLDTPIAAEGALVTSDTGLSAVVDQTGQFSLGGLAGGSRTLTITLPGYHDPQPARPVALGAGATVALPEVVLRLERGDVTGEVEMGDSSPLRDVEVSLELAAAAPDGGVGAPPYSTSAVASASTPSRGTFVLRDVPVGTWAVRASRTSYLSAVSGAVVVQAGRATGAGLLRLTRVQGDFAIDDEDPASVPGFSRRLQLFLSLTGAANAAEYRAAESSSALLAATFTPFSGSLPPSRIPFTLSAGDGTRTVFLQYRDAQSNLSPVLTASVVLDTQAPGSASIELEDGRDFTRSSSTLQVRANALDPVGAGVDVVAGLSALRLGVALLADGGVDAPLTAASSILSVARATTADGPQTVYAQFVDRAGNESAVVQDEVVVDTVPPVGDLTIARGPRAKVDGFTDTSQVDLTLTAAAEPHGGAVQVRLANESATALASAALQPFSPSLTTFLQPLDGLRTVHFQYVDSAGNVGTTAARTIRLDRVAPTLSLTVAQGAFSRVNPVTLDVSGADAVQLAPTPLTLSEDPYFAAGGTTVGPEALPTGGTRAFTLSAGEGLKTVHARVEDAAGNVALAARDVTLDQTPPTGALALLGTLADGARSSVRTSSPSVDVSLTALGASELLLGTEALLACPSSGYTGLVSGVTGYPLSGAASAQVRLCLRDQAGNVFGPASASIAYDAVAPGSCSLDLFGRRVDGADAGTRTALRAVSATVACNEPVQDVYLTEAAVSCTALASLPWQPLTADLTWSLTGPDGLRTVRGCVRDAARNTAALPADTVTLDTQGPVGPTVTLNGGAAWLNASQVDAGTVSLTVVGVAPDAARWAVGFTNPPASFQAVSPVVLTSPAAPEGPRTVFARFEDDLGNASAVVSATLTVDTQPPATTLTTAALQSPADPEFTPSVSSVLAVSGAPADALKAFVAPGAPAGPCVDADFTNAPEQAVVTNYGVLLPPGDGLKRVCLRYADAAGNRSAIVTDTITLDQTAPTAPRLVTANGYARVPNAGAFTLDLAAASTDTNFLRYERAGGLTSGGAPVSDWQPITPVGPATRFTVYLANDGSEEGVRNEVRLRAVDRAGNASPEAALFVTADTNPPNGVDARPTFVDNGDGEATVYWVPPTLPDGGAGDLAGYHVYYGGHAGFVDAEPAAFATQGASPVELPVQGSATLSGLANGSPTYLRVRGFDLAGNEATGAWLADGGTAPLALVPNELSPSELAAVSVGANHLVFDLVRDDEVLYASHALATCGSTAQPLLLSVINLKGLRSPIEGGRANPALPPPSIDFVLTLPSERCAAGQANAELLLSGTWLLLLTPTTLHVLDVSQPRAPRVQTSVALAFLAPGTNFAARSMNLVGDKLTVFGAAGTSNTWFAAVLSLAGLYDGNAGTGVTQVGGTFTAASTQTPQMSGVTRDRLLVNVGTDSRIVNLAPALTAGAAPTLQGSGPTLLLGTSAPVAGNLLYGLTFGGGLTTWQTNALWTGGTAMPVVNASATPASGRLSLLDRYLFGWDGPPGLLRVFDVSELAASREAAAYPLTTTTTQRGAVVAFGNYLAQGLGEVVRLFELASPRALALASGHTNAGNQLVVGKGFLHTGNGAVFDLQAGPVPVRANVAAVAGCETNSAFGDELEVRPRTTGFEVLNTESQVDRDASTTTIPGTLVTLAGSRVTDAELFGNHLVLAEVRAAGVYLEVFNGSKLRNRSGVAMASTDSLGSVQVTGALGTAAVATVLVSGGRAIVGIDDYQATVPSTMGSNFYVVELAGLLDDDAATSGAVVHGPVSMPHVYDVALQGSYAYAATGDGVYVVDVSAALDNLPATVLSSPTTRRVLNGLGLSIDGLSAMGNTLLTAPGEATGSAPPGVYTIDISDPLAPRVVGLYRTSSAGTSCGTAPPSRAHGRLARGGDRVYLTGGGRLSVLRME